jgi:hypothetical protein
MEELRRAPAPLLGIDFVRLAADSGVCQGRPAVG